MPVGWLPGYGPQHPDRETATRGWTAHLKVGARVRHSSFGDGQVVGLEAQGDDQVVTVQFKAAGKKRLSAKAAGLERLGM